MLACNLAFEILRQMADQVVASIFAVHAAVGNGVLARQQHA